MSRTTSEWVEVRYKVVTKMQILQKKIDSIVEQGQSSSLLTNDAYFFRCWLITLLMLQWLPLREAGLITQVYVVLGNTYDNMFTDRKTPHYAKSHLNFFKVGTQWYGVHLFDKTWQSYFGGSFPLPPACNYYFDAYVELVCNIRQQKKQFVVFRLPEDDPNKPLKLVRRWWSSQFNEEIETGKKLLLDCGTFVENFFRKMFTAVVWSVVGTNRPLLEEWARFARHDVITQAEHYVKQDFQASVPWNQHKYGSFWLIQPPWKCLRPSVLKPDYASTLAHLQVVKKNKPNANIPSSVLPRTKNSFQIASPKETRTPVFVGIDTSPLCTAICFKKPDQTLAVEVVFKTSSGTNFMVLNEEQKNWITAQGIVGDLSYEIQAQNSEISVGSQVVQVLKNKWEQIETELKSKAALYIGLEKFVVPKKGRTQKRQMEWTQDVFTHVQAWACLQRHYLVYPQVALIRQVCNNVSRAPQNFVKTHPSKDVWDALFVCIYSESLYKCSLTKVWKGLDM